MNSPPFVLFVLDKDIDNEYITQSLERAHSWDAGDYWDLWLATDSYEDMPRNPPRSMQPNVSVLPPANGTEPPIPESYESSWLGKTVEECARWLQAAPDDIASNKKHFAAMNEFSKEDDTVLLCRINTDNGGFKVDYFPITTEHVAMYLHTSSGSRFEEAFGHYQSMAEDEGRPDKSQGGPYS